MLNYKRLFIVSFTMLGVLLGGAGVATACQLAKLPLGFKANVVMKKFNLKDKFLLSQGSDEIIMRGEKICDGLPKGTIITLSFIDSILVKLLIENTNTEQTLLALAQNEFGKAARKKSKIGPAKEHKNFQTFWGNDEEKFMMYSSFVRGDRQVEHIKLTSKKHKKLMAKSSSEHEKKGR